MRWSDLPKASLFLDRVAENKLANAAKGEGGPTSAEGMMKPGLYFWRAPTSLFLGLASAGGSSPKGGKGAKGSGRAAPEKAKVRVQDPAEAGTTVEVTFGPDEYTGVELRGGKNYSWHSVGSR